MRTDWIDIGYLARGSPRQQHVHRVLQRLGIFQILRAFTPVLAGTIPLEIDVAGSDADIICEAYDLDQFERTATVAFAHCEGFRLNRRTVNGGPHVVVDFLFDEMPVQVFAQPRPVVEQNAYRHMLVEARLLEIGGSRARQAIRALKEAGLKTEPAFGRYFGIEGDPYAVLLEWQDLSDDELRRKVRPKPGR